MNENNIYDITTSENRTGGSFTDFWSQIINIPIGYENERDYNINTCNGVFEVYWVSFSGFKIEKYAYAVKSDKTLALRKLGHKHENTFDDAMGYEKETDDIKIYIKAGIEFARAYVRILASNGPTPEVTQYQKYVDVAGLNLTFPTLTDSSELDESTVKDSLIRYRQHSAVIVGATTTSTIQIENFSTIKVYYVNLVNVLESDGTGVKKIDVTIKNTTVTTLDTFDNTATTNLSVACSGTGLLTITNSQQSSNMFYEISRAL
jgi:hypothetical protein